ncbi:zinc-binding dehydrogenase [Microbacterium sp. A84]|uniref:zinc-binding dehydrogenase n=1 Tax=Microbacterium sp. A84 TaxID=3450715 RepID=UPI003F41E8F1
MKAWEFPGVGQPLRLVDKPKPEPGPGEVLVQIKAAGMCHSDVGFREGSLTALVYTPIVLGHECAGIVESWGDGVTNMQVGDRVGIVGIDYTAPGVGRDGGYAEYVIAKVPEIVSIPEGASFAQAAMGVDAGGTAYKAVRSVGQVSASSRVGIIGLGGLGQIGARTASLTGATVYAAEPGELNRSLAAGLGVTESFEDASSFEGLDLDVIIDFAGYGTTTAVAVNAVKRGGTVVQVGLGRPEATISTQRLVLDEIQLLGSVGTTPADVAAVYDLFASGGLAPQLHPITFDEIGETLEKLVVGSTFGRIVAEF